MSRAGKPNAPTKPIDNARIGIQGRDVSSMNTLASLLTYLHFRCKRMYNGVAALMKRTSFSPFSKAVLGLRIFPRREK